MIFILEEVRAGGLLLGLAVGDALGAPLEGLPPQAVTVREMRGGGIHGLPPGSLTDDTLQAAAVARSLVACRGFAPGDLTRRLLEGYLRHPDLFGPTSAGVFTLLLQGVPPEQAPARVHRIRGGILTATRTTSRQYTPETVLREADGGTCQANRPLHNGETAPAWSFTALQ